MLEHLLLACEIELNKTDVAINFNKSSCLVYVLIDVIMQRAPALRQHYFMGNSNLLFGYLHSQFKSV